MNAINEIEWTSDAPFFIYLFIFVSPASSSLWNGSR